MNINYKAMGISHFDIEENNSNAYLALGESLFLLISSGKTINKNNLLRILASELEKQDGNTHRAYRLALELVGEHGR